MIRVLTIAGSDCSGGAGLQADLKTFHRFGVFGMSAVTLVTVQNTIGVSEVQMLPPELVASQIRAVVEDLGVDAAKTGALGSPEMIERVAAAVREHRIAPLVVDPVMISKHGSPLLAQEAVAVLKRELLPLATVLTPNVHEAEALLGRKLTGEQQLAEAARALCDLGPRAVVLKGVLTDGQSLDLLCERGELHRFTAPRLETPHTHGTGCTFSAAIAALLARGRSGVEAVGEAKAWLSRAIEEAPGLGRGRGPVNHWA